jgi:Flp pilus assembly protein TadG
MLRYYRGLIKKKLFANGSGQAAAELAGAMLIIVPLLCATIDFGRAFYQLQVVSELSRQGSSLAMRGEGTTSCDTMCTAIADLVAGSSGLNLAANGKVIMTALTPTASQTNGAPSGGPYLISKQETSSGSFSATSKLGSSGTVSIPGAPLIQTGQTMYVTEIFYGFTPATPLGTSIGIPTKLYDIAYF